MSTVPPPSRCVLTALRPTAPTTEPDSEEPTAVTCAFVRLEAALEAHFAALATLDRIEEAVVTAHGYPRVPLPNRTGTPDYAADAATITRRLGSGPTARRLTAELRRRQATFVQAAAGGDERHAGTDPGGTTRRGADVARAA